MILPAPTSTPMTGRLVVPGDDGYDAARQSFNLVLGQRPAAIAFPVDEDELFWALRGGGGNFGVVTAIEFAVYPIAELYAGTMFFPFARASEVLHAWRSMLPSLPEGMMTWAAILHIPDLPDFPAEMRG